VTVLFSDLKPTEFALKLQKTFGKLSMAPVTPVSAKAWKMDYLVTKLDPEGKAIAGIECKV